MAEHVEHGSTPAVPSSPQSVPSSLPASSPQSADSTPEQLAEARYLKALDHLVSDAAENKRIPLLVDGLAWTLACIAVRYGALATGDVLRSLGGYMCGIETRRQAAEEAHQAKQEGRLPH